MPVQTRLESADTIVQKSLVHVGLIGCGYWGPNLLRNFSELDNCHVACVAEINEQRRQYIHRKYPSLETTEDYRRLFEKDIDAVIIATPAKTHYELVRGALLAGKHVLVEKPLAMTSSEAGELIQLASERDLKLMVGHTFAYNAAVRALKNYIVNGEIGRPYYLYAQRLNLGIVREDINALWNLAPHDISILLYLFEGMPVTVSAKGYAYLQEGIEDVVFLTLHYADGLMAHLHVSWLDPNKVRRMTLVGSEKMIVYDDVSEAKIQIYDKGIRRQNIKDTLGDFDDFAKFQLIHRAGDVLFPKVHFVEPLKTECAHFLECILDDKTPLTDGFNGRAVVKILEAAQMSLTNSGQNIQIED